MELTEVKCVLFFLRQSVALTSILAFSGCSPVMEYRGKLPETQDLNRITPGRHTKEDVLNLIGTPSTVAAFDTNTWIYDYTVFERKAFFWPEEKKHALYVIRFDDRNKVKEIVKSDERLQDVRLVDRTTRRPEEKQGIFTSIFGNFGYQAKTSKDNQ